MGRGRAKAKQTKVARELKYRPIEPDFSSLERELRGSLGDDYQPTDDAVPDPYDEPGSQYEDEDEEGGYSGHERRSS